MKTKHLTLIGMLVVLAFIIGLYGYWSLEGTLFHKVLDPQEITVKTTKDVYLQGETVEGTVSVCQFRDVPMVVQWSLIDTYLRTYPRRDVRTFVKDCVEDKLLKIEVIPPGVPTEDYYFSGTLTIQLNPIKYVIIPLKSNPFRVIEK